MDLVQLTATILQKLPLSSLPTAEDAALIQRNRAFFEQHEAALIKGFYDEVFGDTHLKHYLNSAQRSQREETLRQWYRVTTHGNFDEAYWQWQVFVGIVHVKHGISNSSMMGMWRRMISFLQERLFLSLPHEEAQAVLTVLQKLQVSVSSLIVESYLLTEREAIKRVSGLKDKILDRFIHIEIDALLVQGRRCLTNSAITSEVA